MLQVQPDGSNKKETKNVKAAIARLASQENLTSSYDLVLGLVRRPPSPRPWASAPPTPPCCSLLTTSATAASCTTLSQVSLGPSSWIQDPCTWIQITELNECRGWQQRRGAHIGDWWQPGLGWAEMNPLLIYTAQPSPAQLDQDGSLNVIWQKVHFCGGVRCSAGRHSTPASQQREVC